MKFQLSFAVLYLLMISACAPNPSGNDASDMENEPAPADTSPPAPVLATIPADAGRLSSNAYDYQVFIPLFPEILSYTGKQTTGGENYKMGAGMIATATASYSHNDRRFNVTIHDVGDNTELITDIAKWNSFTANEDNEEEIQKNFTVNNNPAFLHFDKTRKSGSLSVITYSRFIIDITGRNIKPDDLDLALDNLKIERFK